MSIGIQGELLADEDSCVSMDATIVCGYLTHCATGASRTDRTGGVCISRPRSTKVKDDLVGDVERVESLMLGLDDECVELGVRGTAGWCRRTY